MSKERIISTNQNRIKLLGDNILYNNGIISAFYILPVVNYSDASRAVKEGNIEDLTNLLSSLSNNRNGITFTIERIDKIIKAKDVRANLLETIKMYLPDTEMPPEFSNVIKDDIQTYCLLSIDIKQSEFSDIESYTMKEAIKEVFNQIIDNIASIGSINIDEKKIFDIEDNIYSVIRHKCLRASRELVFYTFCSKIYPCYELSYDRLGHINNDSYEAIMGNLANIYEDGFGYFKMYNIGVDLFGLPVQETYGCMLTIKQFPLVIDNANFPMNFPNCIISGNTLKKDVAKLKFKRERAQARFEERDSIGSNAEIEDSEESMKSIDLTTRGIREVNAGEVMCEFEVSLLVTGVTLEELRKNVSSTLTILNDRNIIAVKSLEQTLCYWKNYISCRPLDHSQFASLKLALSTQMNRGATMGDANGTIFSPAIGESV